MKKTTKHFHNASEYQSFTLSRILIPASQIVIGTMHFSILLSLGLITMIGTKAAPQYFNDQYEVNTTIEGFGDPWHSWYDCEGTNMCKALPAEYCDNAILKIQPTDELIYGSPVYWLLPSSVIGYLTNIIS